MVFLHTHCLFFTVVCGHKSHQQVFLSHIRSNLPRTPRENQQKCHCSAKSVSLAEVYNRGWHTSVDERDNTCCQGKKKTFFSITNDSSISVSICYKDLAGKNNLNVTDIKYFSDYIPAKYQDLQNIVSESYRRTRSNQKPISIFNYHVFTSIEFVLISLRFCWRLLGVGWLYVVFAREKTTWQRRLHGDFSKRWVLQSRFKSPGQQTKWVL